MPRYDYRCPSCGNIKEYRESYPDKDKEHVCTNCNANMKRIISAPNFYSVKKKIDWKHSERRKLWNSKDPKDVMKLTN